MVGLGWYHCIYNSWRKPPRMTWCTNVKVWLSGGTAYSTVGTENVKNASKEKANPRGGNIGREGYRPHVPCFNGCFVCITAPTHIHLDREVCVLVYGSFLM